MPFCSSDSIVVRTGDSFTTIGSVTTIASFVPSSLRSMPTSRLTPTPTRTDETAISKGVIICYEAADYSE